MKLISLLEELICSKVAEMALEAFQLTMAESSPVPGQLSSVDILSMAMGLEGFLNWVDKCLVAGFPGDGGGEGGCTVIAYKSG